MIGGGTPRRAAGGDAAVSLRPRSAAAAARMPTWAPPELFGGAVVVLALVLAGYLFFNRPFAYVRLPGLPIFVGEIALGVLLLQVARVPGSVRAVLRDSVPARLVLALVLLAVLLVPSGFARDGMDAPRDAAPLVYGLFAIGIAVILARSPALLPRLVGWYRRILPWFLVWAPASIFLGRAFEHQSWYVPGSEVSVFAYKAGDTAVHLGAALAFLWIVDGQGLASTIRQRVLMAMGLAGILMAGSVTRGGLAACAVMLTLAFLRYVPRRRMLVGVVGGVLGLLLSFAVVTDVRIDLGTNRDVSVHQLVANIASSVGADVGDEGYLEANTSWRLGLWGEVVEDVREGHIAILGIGMGPNLADRYGYSTGAVNSDQRLRSVHNSHLTVLVRMGLLGAALWLALWFAWFRHIDRIGRVAGGLGAPLEARVAAWAIVVVTGFHVNAFFDAALEGPHASIWLWVVTGMGIAATRLARPPGEDAPTPGAAARRT